MEGSNHTVSLATTFEATVNGTNGLHALLSDCQIGVIRAEETQGPSIASPNRMRFRSRKGTLPKGVIAVTNDSGGLVTRLPLSGQRLLPGESMEFTAEHAGLLKSGKYRVMSLMENEAAFFSNSAEFTIK